MDSPRESKRRKLDTPSKHPPAPTQTSTRKRATPKTALSGTPASRAKQARAGLSPFSHTKENAQPQDVNVAGTAQSAVEKLRARRQERVEDAAPAAAAAAVVVEKAPETPSKSLKMAGFFKKFADPKLASMRATEKGISDEQISSGVDVDIVEDESDGGSAVSALRASGRKKLLSTKLREQAERTQAEVRRTPVSRKKKTFEDEIREVEEAARKEADGTSTPANGRRAGSRAQTPKRSNGVETTESTSSEVAMVGNKTPVGRKTPIERKTPAEGKTPAGRVASAEKKPRGRPRKIVDSETVTVAPQPVPEGQVYGDVMEVDDSEEERTAAARSTVAPAPARPQASATPQQRSVVKPRRAAAEEEGGSLPTLDQTQMQLFQRITLEKIYGKRLVPLKNLNDEYTKVNTVISQTITAGESNSMLLIGARGSGKTALINHILREQATEHPDDFHVVRLNGFIHTDDKIALREIWRQLGREMELDEEENYAELCGHSGLALGSSLASTGARSRASAWSD
jgi:origin recognition complex subunit 4